MNLFYYEIKANIKSLIIWSVSVIALVAMGMGKYTGMSSSGDAMKDMMDALPKTLTNIMGMSGFDITTVMGYFGVCFFYIVLMLTIHAVMLGAGIISKEENDKTSEFLMVKPITRKQIITAKLFVSFINIIILNIVTLASSVISLNMVGDGESYFADTFMLMLGVLLLQALFMSIGLLVATVKKNPKTVSPLSMGILLFTFMLSMIINAIEKLEWLEWITPFKYFEAQDIIIGNGYSIGFVILTLVLIAISIIGSYISYDKRDMNT